MVVENHQHGTMRQAFHQPGSSRGRAEVRYQLSFAAHYFLLRTLLQMARVSAATVSQLRVDVRAISALSHCFERAASSATRNAAGSRGSTSMPDASVTNSGMPPTRVATNG